MRTSFASSGPRQTWMSSRKASANFEKAVRKHTIKDIEFSPPAWEMDKQKSAFLNQLDRATGVFFTGGDQNRIMDVLRDESLLTQLQKQYHAGIVFGGTSAGTAIMSHTMIRGDNGDDVIDPSSVPSRPGLGLLTDLIVDQHFIKRRRENRLLSLLLTSKETLGVGIDEGTALGIEDGRYAKVLGPKQVMVIDKEAPMRRQANSRWRS